VRRPEVAAGRVEILMALSLALAGCAEHQAPAQTIEPPTESAEVGTRSQVLPTEFVLSREPASNERPRAEQPIHVGDKWWRFRSDFLKLPEDQVRDRDAAVSSRQPPAAFWDAQTSIEAVSVWGVLCNQCHGGRRRVEDVVSMPAPPDTWGRGVGLFFGARRPYVDVFAMVNNGGPIRDDKRAMPAWRNILAREQIWALLYFLEYQSGGIEGRFPPSLYPRMQTEVGEAPPPP
jgi:hypothetical protein